MHSLRHRSRSHGRRRSSSSSRPAESSRLPAYQRPVGLMLLCVSCSPRSFCFRPADDAGGYINPPQQRNGWSQQGGNQTQGYYRNNRQQQQNQYLDGGYMNDQGGGGWNQGGQQRGNRPGFAGGWAGAEQRAV